MPPCALSGAPNPYGSSFGVRRMAEHSTIDRPPFMRVLRAASWGLSAGEARYYGWRIFLHVGPLAIYAWPGSGREG